MPKILTTISGIYPKVGLATPSLRENLHRLDRGEIDAAELEKIVAENISAAVVEQSAAGITLPADPLTGWTDIFAPFVTAWPGLSRRGIHRFFDTNTLYGEPVLSGKLGFELSKATADFQIAASAGARKAQLPGVFTFAAAIQTKMATEELSQQLAENLKKEAESLAAAGAEFIEIHEPALGHSEFEVAEIEAIYKNFAELPILVSTYFANFSRETTVALIAAGVGVGLDFSAEVSEIPAAKILQIGAINTRETRMESAEVLAELSAKVTESLADTILFSTNSHVEYLPHDRAVQKIALLKSFLK